MEMEVSSHMEFFILFKIYDHIPQNVSLSSKHLLFTAILVNIWEKAQNKALGTYILTLGAGKIVYQAFSDEEQSSISGPP